MSKEQKQRKKSVIKYHNPHIDEIYNAFQALLKAECKANKKK